MAQNHTLCMSVLVLYLRLSQGEWVAPVVHSLLKLESMVAGGASDQWITITNHGFFFIKKTETYHDGNWIGLRRCGKFPRFMIIESTETPITNLSPFLIEKVIPSNMTLLHVKKIKNQTLLVEVDKRKNADFLLKMTKFHTINVKTYPHKSLNISKGVVRSKELSLCTIDEIKKKMKKQGLTEVRRVIIKKTG